MIHSADKHRRSVRAAFLVLLTSLCVIFLIAYAGKAMAIGLKENSVVQDETIKLGDIFYGLSDQENKVLGPAPRPGSEMILNARTLMRIAIALDLPWRPSSSAEQVVLKRAATVIGRNHIENELKQALRKKGVEGSFNLLFLTPQNDIILPQEQPETLEVGNLSIDAAGESFEATLTAPSPDNPIHHRTVRGKIEKIVPIPVLRETMRQGSIIGKRDITFVDVRGRDLSADIVIEENSLVGMTPRRMIIAGTAVKANEIEAPTLVSRGALVTMVYKDGPLVLTAKGKALENGAKDDLIRVVNTGSNRTLEAVVTSAREVTVQSN